MSKQSHLAKASQPNGSHAVDRGATSSVGYGRPPVHTRFKPGQSGNPKGRRKGQRNVHTVLAETLNQRIRIREGDRTRSLTKLDGWILTMVSAALKGERRQTPESQQTEATEDNEQSAPDETTPRSTEAKS